jgi:hypothetical protein
LVCAKCVIDTPGAGPSLTDWIIAVSGVFAAVGTVGAVVLALSQTRRQGRRSLIVECRQGIAAISAVEAVPLIVLRATNDGPRPIKVVQAYVQTDDSRKIVSPFTRFGEQLPQLLLDGESVEIAWEATRLEESRVTEGVPHYLFAYFVDTVGRVYPAPYPGVDKVTSGPPWKRRVTWKPRAPHASPESPPGSE